MSRTVCISLVVCCLAAGPAAAQVSPEVAPIQAAGALFRAPEPQRPAALVPMYASLVTLQTLDVVSTTRALSSGGAYEANPVMRGVVGSPAAFLAVKAGTTAGTIWIAERMRKKHPVRATVFMASTNAMMAAVVAHNLRIR